MPAKDPHQLREEAASAVARGKLDTALALYGELEQIEPMAAAWPKRVGETYRRLGDIPSAVTAFERAVDKYVTDGLLVQAIAVCKMILQLDPSHASTAHRLAELATPSAKEARAIRAPRTPAPLSPMTKPAIETSRPRIAPVAATPAVARTATADRGPAVSRTGTDLGTTPASATAPAVSRTSTDLGTTPASATTPPAVSRTSTDRAGGAPVVARTGTAERVPPPAPAEPARATTEERGTTIKRSERGMQPIAKTSPAELAERAARRAEHRRPVTIPPGGALDAIPLAMAMPDSQRVVRADGTDAGMTLLRVEIPLDDLGEDDDVEIEVVDPARVALLRTPIFAKLSPTALEQLIARLELREVMNEEVVREGETGTTLFVVAEGEVEVTSRGEQLATLGPGTFFGEIALVTDLPRSATIKANGRVELLAIDREVVRAAAAEQPEIIGALLGFVRDRLVDRITRTSALFQPFTEEERAELAKRFELVEVDVGARLIEQDKRADGLYIVLAGRVEVARRGESALATLLSGDVFGEMSLMSAKGSTANVTALTRVLALRLPATIFQEVIMTYPQVLAYLGELSESRSKLKQAEDVLDLHIDLI